MKVLVWPAGDENDATTQYRLLMPAQALIDQGADIEITRTGPKVLWDHDWSRFPEPPPHVSVMGVERPDADVVVLQRPGRRWWADVIPFLRAEGVKVVVDVDDLFDRIHRKNIARGDFDATKRQVHNHTWVDLACERADIVTCTTPALKDRYGHGHGRVLPNLIPQAYLDIEARPWARTMGWTGNVQTHPTDLQATRGAVRDVLKETMWDFHVIGTGLGVQEALELPEAPSASGHVPFAEYAEALAQLMVGIVPLDDTPFNQAKSCLKMIELAAVGVAVVATGTYDNRRMFDLGVGAIVKHPSHWYKRLKAMVENEQLRADTIGRSRAALARLTYEKQANRWADAWGLNTKVKVPA